MSSPTSLAQRLDYSALHPFLLDEAGMQMSDATIEKITGLTAYRSYRIRGWVTERQADILACRVVKVHPMLIWGDDWFTSAGATVAPPERAIA